MVKIEQTIRVYHPTFKYRLDEEWLNMELFLCRKYYS